MIEATGAGSYAATARSPAAQNLQGAESRGIQHLGCRLPTSLREIIRTKRMLLELWGEGVVFYDFKRLNYSLKTGYVGHEPYGLPLLDRRPRTVVELLYSRNGDPAGTPALESQNNPNPVGIIDPWVQ